MWNPLRTLAGRLILVTIAAIALSYVAVFTLVFNERGASLRRFAETNVAERVASTAQRIREAPARDRPALVRAMRDFGVRYRIVDAPQTQANTGPSAQRIARLVSEALGGVEARAHTRIVEVTERTGWRRRYEARAAHEQHMAPDRAPLDAPAGAGAPPPPRDVIRMRVVGPDGPRFRATQATILVSLGGASWLEARATLPAPRPFPMSYVWAALGSMFAVGLGAVLVSRQIGRPLEDLTRAAQRLGAGEANVQVPATGPDDVKRASEAFNAMAARLGRQMNRQRHMLWALSHDLRTPITALRLRAELLDDDATRQKLMTSIAEMETLTEQALALARAGASEETREIVDLAEIARTLCGELEELGVAIRADAPAPVNAPCRPTEIARALRNLAENASKYGGGGVMRARREGANAILEVLDEGPGLSADELKRVTEPFYRADAARGDGRGAGLGLAIVQAIADGHGGRFVLENRTPRGLRAALVLPAA